MPYFIVLRMYLVDKINYIHYIKFNSRRKKMKKVNYLNNKDMLAEIHKSKNTFCSFTDPAYHRYDLILPSVDKINIRTVADIIHFIKIIKLDGLILLIDFEKAFDMLEHNFMFKSLEKTDGNDINKFLQIT